MLAGTVDVVNKAVPIGHQGNDLSAFRQGIKRWKEPNPEFVVDKNSFEIVCL
jgi:hypothetical protein